MPTRVRVALGFALLWATALVVGALTVPVYDGSSGSPGTATLVAVNGTAALVVSALPLVAALAVTVLLRAAPRHRVATRAAWVVVALLGVVAVLGLLSVGILLLPVVAALTVAVGSASPPAPAGRGAPPGGPPVNEKADEAVNESVNRQVAPGPCATGPGALREALTSTPLPPDGVTPGGGYPDDCEGHCRPV